MDRLSVRKLYIDSRYRASGTASNFEYELPETVELPKNTRAFITEFTGVNGWDTVNSSNNQVYLLEQWGVQWANRIVTIPENPYDTDGLRAMLESRLNDSKRVYGTYSVTRSTANGDASSAASGTAYRFFTVELKGGGTFQIAPEEFLRDPAWKKETWLGLDGPDYDVTNPKSTNELFSFLYDSWTTYNALTISTFIDLRSKHNLYVHSPSFGHYTSIGPNGVRTILCKIPVESAYGTVIHYAHSGSAYDFIEVGTSALRMLSFSLLDAKLNEVDLRGGHWSLTICLATEDT